MLEPVDESVVRSVESTHNQLSARTVDIDYKREGKIVEERNTEKSDDSGAGQKTGEYKSDDEGIFFEKQNEHGDIIIRLPQKHMIIDTVA